MKITTNLNWFCKPINIRSNKVRKTYFYLENGYGVDPLEEIPQNATNAFVTTCN